MNLIVAARVNQCTQKATLSVVQLLLQLLLHPAAAVALLLVVMSVGIEEYKSEFLS